MKKREKLDEIENLLCDLYNNYADLDGALLYKYSAVDVSDDEYLNDVNFLRYLNREICKFLGKNYD